MDMDLERERQRLQQLYASITDGELLNIAQDIDGLTDVAREAMQAELAKRKLEVEPSGDDRDVAVESVPESPAPRFGWTNSLRSGPWNQRHSASIAENVTIPEGAVLATVAEFRDLSEALMAKGTLESAGIPCVLANENMIRLDWQLSHFLGGVRLQVHADDAEEATKILREPIPESIDVEGVGTYEQPRCPRCHSLDINFRENTPAAYGSMFLLPVPVVRDGWICHTCGHEWRDGSDAED